jgi:hypothetical protein
LVPGVAGGEKPPREAQATRHTSSLVHASRPPDTAPCCAAGQTELPEVGQLGPGLGSGRAFSDPPRVAAKLQNRKSSPSLKEPMSPLKLGVPALKPAEGKVLTLHHTLRASGDLNRSNS